VRRVESCCAIGRNSVEATNACLIRAVRAALADLPACVLPVLLDVFRFVLEAAGLVLFLAVVCAESSGCAAAPAAVCPAIGDTAINIAKAPASALICPGAKCGEFTTLMFSL
jgi:hypothetical protein